MNIKVALILVFLLMIPSVCLAEVPLTYESLLHGIVGTIIYGAIGIVMACVGYKAVDLLTPGKLSHDIVENSNVAVAIVAAAMVLGICIIIAAAIAG